MLVINVKENDSLEKALKKFKKKFEKTGVVKELRARQAFRKALHHQAYAENSCGVQTADANR